MVEEKPKESILGSLDFGLVGVIPPYVPFTRSYDVTGKTILFFAGDRGGYNAAIGALEKARNAGVNVRLYLVGTCADQFRRKELITPAGMEVSTGAPTIVEMNGFFTQFDHDLTVIAASQSKEGTDASYNAVYLSGGKPTIMVQDMYLSGMQLLRVMSTHVRRVCVTDEFSRSLIVKELPRFTDRVVVTGGAQFDKTVEVKRNWGQRRAQLRQAMGVTDDHLVFLIAGGLNGTAEMLELVEEGTKLAGVADRAKIILRAHPRATDEDKRLTQQYMDATNLDRFTDVGRRLAPASEDLLPGVDFAVSGYSTVNYYGILYQMPGVVYAGTPSFKRDLKAEKGLERPPQVEPDVHAGWYVQDGFDMKVVIEACAPDNINLRAKIIAGQARIAQYNDGHAAERVWQEMQKLMADK